MSAPNPNDERAPLPETLERPAKGRVLLFAPHADDDVIGCGGTLALHADQGDPIRVVIAFDGRLGDPDRRHNPEEYVRRRQAEAVRAGAHLGLDDYVFWDFPEGHEPGEEELRRAAERAADEIRMFRPDILYAPWIGEQHIDHHVLARVIRLALPAAGFEGAAWGYEVWTPLVPTLIVDVSSKFDQKSRALEEHLSQHEEIEAMPHKALAISAQRAMYLSPAARHGEGFCPLA